MNAAVLAVLVWLVLSGLAAVVAGRFLSAAEAGDRAEQRAAEDLFAFLEADLRGDATAAGPLR